MWKMRDERVESKMQMCQQVAKVTQWELVPKLSMSQQQREIKTLSMKQVLFIYFPDDNIHMEFMTLTGWSLTSTHCLTGRAAVKDWRANFNLRPNVMFL